MPHLITTLGPKQSAEMGIILPHEHVFVDLRTWDQPGYAHAKTSDVIALMAPEIKKAQASGISAIVDCGPVGVGRRADILKAVSLATGFPILVPTGVYREPWIPPWIHAASEEALYNWMRGELEEQIVDVDHLIDGDRLIDRDRLQEKDDLQKTGVQAGFVKLSAGDDGITATETRVLRAAARAAAATHAVIGSHTIRGRVVRDQIKIIEEAGYTPLRFIWIHTQAEPDFNLHLEMARRGAWLEYDSIGSPDSDPQFIEWILRLLDAGFGDQILLSHDRGWFDPAQPGGGQPKPYTYLVETFLPKLRAAGVPKQMITHLVCENPFRAFARD